MSMQQNKDSFLRSDTRVLIVLSTFQVSRSFVHEAFIAAQKILDPMQIDYEAIEVSGSREIPSAIAFQARRKYFSWSSMSAKNVWDGFIALGAIMGEGSEQDRNRIIISQQIDNLTTHRGLSIGDGIATGQQEKPEYWGANATDACVRQIEMKQETPVFTLGFPRSEKPLQHFNF